MNYPVSYTPLDVYKRQGHRFDPYNVHHGPVGQLVRMPACHAGGRRFEPVPDRQFLFRGCLLYTSRCV